MGNQQEMQKQQEKMRERLERMQRQQEKLLRQLVNLVWMLPEDEQLWGKTLVKPLPRSPKSLSNKE